MSCKSCVRVLSPNLVFICVCFLNKQPPSLSDMEMPFEPLQSESTFSTTNAVLDITRKSCQEDVSVSCAWSVYGNFHVKMAWDRERYKAEIIMTSTWTDGAVHRQREHQYHRSRRGRGREGRDTGTAPVARKAPDMVQFATCPDPRVRSSTSRKNHHHHPHTPHTSCAGCTATSVGHLQSVSSVYRV